MSTEGMVAFVTAAYAVRWILAVLVVIALAALVAAANDRADRAEKRAKEWEAWADQLEDENADLRAQLRPQIVALPPRPASRTRS